MKNKGFVLMETIVVIVVISVALLTIFSSYSKILSKVKSENKYDTSEYIYMTKYIKEHITSPKIIDICPNVTSSPTATTCGTPKDQNNNSPTNLTTNLISGVESLYGVSKIYILTNINNFDKKISNNASDGKNSKYFDAYMIDYIKKLDVNDNDQLIIVEYKRPVLKTDGTQKKMYYYDSTGGKQEKELYETYIASLEW